jgi:hypothetical protein
MNSVVRGRTSGGTNGPLNSGRLVWRAWHRVLTKEQFHFLLVENLSILRKQVASKTHRAALHGAR